jgi:hypothetical protein
MATNTSNIPALLLPGIRKLKGDYAEIPTQWSQVFSSGTSEMAVERTLSMRYLGQASIKTQGSATQFDNLSGQRFTYNHIHVAIGLGYSWTREAIDDNLYKSQFDPSNLGLLRSFRQTKEIIAADILNTGNVYNTTIGGDGQALFSTAHPVDGNTVANTSSTPLGLNESSLITVNNLIRRFRDNAGLLMGAQGKKLVVPVELRHTAKRLIETPLRPGTADNDIATIKENDDLVGGYVVMDFLTSPYAWFMLSDQGGLIHLERKPFETSMHEDFVTGNLMVKGYERYVFSYDDWRCAAGQFPTS